MTTENGDLVESGGKVRLFTNQFLNEGVHLTPTATQCHYLLRVMRAKAGAKLRLFNGRDGEWRARVAEAHRNDCVLCCEKKIAEQSLTHDLWLVFAPIKKTPAEYLTQKATELGVRVLQPVITHRAVVRRVNVERMTANAIEAAEQSGRMDVPEVREAASLEPVLAQWPHERTLVFCDEAGEAPPIADALAQRASGAWGVLTGPEGGFDDRERALIRAHASVIAVTLGPRVMRADTAAISALAIVAAMCGDWRGG